MKIYQTFGLAALLGFPQAACVQPQRLTNDPKASVYEKRSIDVYSKDMFYSDLTDEELAKIHDFQTRANDGESLIIGKTGTPNPALQEHLRKVAGPNVYVQAFSESELFVEYPFTNYSLTKQQQ